MLGLFDDFELAPCGAYAAEGLLRGPSFETARRLTSLCGFVCWAKRSLQCEGSVAACLLMLRRETLLQILWALPPSRVGVRFRLLGLFDDFELAPCGAYAAEGLLRGPSFETARRLTSLCGFVCWAKRSLQCEGSVAA